ncbi:MAG: DUF4391 domain-containing protein [Acidaminococcaceae bacterium]|nr:DUF4391 domain-containing protein [Acidaminococcaceae bacterium]
MLGLPKTTEFNKRIPKQKFYGNLSLSPVVKKHFAEQIRIIYWRNKIATSTVNLVVGENVKELQVFEILLNQTELDEAVLTQIDRTLPYHILFVLTYDDKQRACIAYKKATASGGYAFKVQKYYYTDWLPTDKMQLAFAGRSLDAVYENYVRQIAGNNIETNSKGNLQNDVERSERKRILQKQIDDLLAKIRKEVQFNRQVELNAEVKKLQKMLDSV